MECLYCKEDVRQGAIKCKHCGEFLKFKVRLVPLLRTLVQVVIPILSLSLAFFEFARANKAQEAAATAEDQTEQTVAILERMPKDLVLNTARTDLDPQAFSEIAKGNFVRAEEQFRIRLRENPMDNAAKRGLIYSGVLKKIEQREGPE